jgi:hypothetical protein
MKAFVFGVCNWDSEFDFKRQEDNLWEWYNRVDQFISIPKKICLTAGSFSEPSLNPLPCDLYQTGLHNVYDYNNSMSYFRLGFMTGLWKFLLEYQNDFDLLIHLQVRHLLGVELKNYIEKFMSQEEQVMGMRYDSQDYAIRGIDVGFLAMKKDAARMYCATGTRQCLDNRPEHVIDTCEEEAYKLFADSWWNPWPTIPTVRQIDSSQNVCSQPALLTITDTEYFKALPMIASGKHVQQEYYDAWINEHPLKRLD